MPSFDPAKEGRGLEGQLHPAISAMAPKACAAVSDSWVSVFQPFDDGRMNIPDDFRVSYGFGRCDIAREAGMNPSIAFGPTNPLPSDSGVLPSFDDTDTIRPTTASRVRPDGPGPASPPVPAPPGSIS